MVEQSIEESVAVAFRTPRPASSSHLTHHQGDPFLVAQCLRRRCLRLGVLAASRPSIEPLRLRSSHESRSFNGHLDRADEFLLGKLRQSRLPR